MTTNLTVSNRNLKNQLTSPSESLGQRLADAPNFRRNMQPGARDYGSRLINIVDRNVGNNLRAAERGVLGEEMNKIIIAGVRDATITITDADDVAVESIGGADNQFLRLTASDITVARRLRHTTFDD